MFIVLLNVLFELIGLAGSSERDVASVTRGRWTEVRMAPGDGVAAAGGAGQGSTRIPTPEFSEDNFRSYTDEIELWREVYELPKAKQGIMLLLVLPRDTPSDIKGSISASVGTDELNKETGIKKFVAAMDKAFKPLDKIRELEINTNYYVNMKKKEEESVGDYMNRFYKPANFAKRREMDLPLKVKGLKLLHDAGL